jgi:hypothetical protein
MIGIGSERKSGKKTTVEECLSLDAGRLVRMGVLANTGCGGASLTWSNRFGEQTLSVPYWADYRAGRPILHLFVAPPGSTEAVDEKVPLENTRPHFGGQRWWFLCPLVKNGEPCERRVRKLYRSPSTWYFGCRTCMDLTYRSVQEHDKRVDRLVRHFYEIPAALESKDPLKVFLACKAYGKLRKWY